MLMLGRIAQREVGKMKHVMLTDPLSSHLRVHQRFNTLPLHPLDAHFCKNRDSRLYGNEIELSKSMRHAYRLNRDRPFELYQALW